ncbi:MAG TPA: polysaccharide deacetylase family protein [Edaphobacter sp.]|nr:polysaccharide deacetylase family protein [Edaphobacter sp.]
MNAPTITTAAAALTTAGLLAVGCTYAALSAQSQLFGDVLIASRNPDEIALTYDDGPNDIVTERLLDVLAYHNIRASFFLIGRYVRQRPQIARTIAASGHLIGNHTMTHPWLAWQSSARIRQELAGCNALLEDTLGIPVRYFRAPHGARRPAVLRIARSLGLTPVQWNIIAKDWQPVGPEEIAARTIRGITRNRRQNRASNIVLHDGGQKSLGQPRLPTVEATKLLLDKYNSEPEMKFVTVDSWMQ